MNAIDRYGDERIPLRYYHEKAVKYNIIPKNHYIITDEKIGEYFVSARDICLMVKYGDDYKTLTSEAICNE